MPDRAQDVRFAHVAVKWKYVNAEQAKECLRQQAEEGSSRPVSEILVEKGYITSEQAGVISELAEEADKPKQLGGFELISKIAEGGMGAVYKAKQLSLDRTVAVKILPKKLARDTQFVARFFREAKLAAQFSHPNIVGAVDAGEAGGIHYFAMEYVEGRSLGQIVRRDKVLPESRALEVVTQIARALECADRHGMVHRDVKPDNILIDGDGTAKLADLGLARSVSDESTRLTQAGTAMGSPHYVSPEQARGEPDIDVRADIYSLGATFYHLVTGATPFSGQTPAVIMTKHLNETARPPSAVRPSVSDATSRVIMKMMVKDRDKRYQTPPELIVDLERISRGEEPEALATDITLALSASDLQPRSAAPLWALGATAVILAAVVVGGVLVFRAREGGAEKDELARARALIEAGELEEAGYLLGAVLAEHPEVRDEARELIRKIEEMKRGAKERSAGAKAKERSAEARAKEAADELGAVEALLAEGKPGPALARARAGPEKFPQKREAFEELASRATKLLDEEKREEMFRAAVAKAGGLMGRKAYADASEAFAKALEIRDDAEVRWRRTGALFLDARIRGEAAEAADDVQGAIASYQEALTIRPDPELAGRLKRLQGSVECVRLLARAGELGKKGEFALARKELEPALALASEVEKEAVSRRLEKLASKEKALADALGKAKALLESCHLDKCVAEAGKALALRPGDPEAGRLKRSAQGKMSVESPIGMSLVYFPGGEFTMGGASGDEDERPARTVTLSHFYLSRSEVTNKQYELFRPTHRSQRKYSKGDECPAVRVSWDDAREFCEWLSKGEGLRYSLPTEAQWEYAATGAGRNTLYPWGSSPPDAGVCNIGWGPRDRWASDGHEFASPAGSFPKGADPRGVVDLIGNVWEWCLDWYSPDYYSRAWARGVDPAGPAAGEEKVLRGGSFIDPADRCRSRYRSKKNPAAKAANFGFRVVREAK